MSTKCDVGFIASRHFLADRTLFPSTLRSSNQRSLVAYAIAWLN